MVRIIVGSLALACGTLFWAGSGADAQVKVKPQVKKAGGGQPGKGNQEIQINVLDEVVVRTKSIPLQFDEKGKPRKMTSEEKKQLKGEGGLPGYAADYGDVRVGIPVSVQLARASGLPKAASGANDEKVDEEKPKTKPKLTILGDIAGVVTRIDGTRNSQAMPKAAKKNDGKRPPTRAVRTLGIRVNGLPPGVGNRAGQEGNSLGDEIVISRIMILEQPPKVPGQE